VNEVPFQTPRLRALWAVFLTIFLDLVGFGMFIPILVTLASDFGATPAAAASINTWHSLGTLLAVFLLGRLSDRWGRKPVLMVTIAVSALAQLATGYAGSMAALMVARFVAGAAAGNISVAQACISDLTPPEKRASSMALIGLAFGGGFAIGPALGALISRWAGDDYLLALGWVAFALNFINLVFVSRMLRETHPKWQGASRPKKPESPAEIGEPVSGPSMFRDFSALARQPALRILFAMQLLQVFGFVGLETVLPLVLRDGYGFDKSQTFDAFVILGMAVLFCNGVLARKLLLYWDERHAIKAGQYLLCAGIAGVHLAAPQALPLYLALSFIACGTAFSNPAISSLTSKLCPPEQVGMTFGALQMVSTTGRILGPVAMGFVYQSAGGLQSLWATVVLIGLASLLAWRLPQPGVLTKT
jgi:DHA1 family tetracycline resistance protein-like MFS transporter